MKRLSPRRAFLALLAFPRQLRAYARCAARCRSARCSDVAAATCIVLARPAFGNDHGRARRSMSAAEPDIDALVIGRLMRLALGLVMQSWLAATFR